MAIDMTGQMSPPQRAEEWRSRRVFYVTPQCLEKDIQSGTCPVNDIVCLVVDEAHRATGNFSYCVVTRELLARNIKFRILALTATPGSKQVTIQAVVDNLLMSCLEYRDENDPDVSQYTHNRKLELIQVKMNAETNKIKDIYLEILKPVVDKLYHLGVFYSREFARLSPFEFITARDKFRQAPPQSLQQHQYREVESFFSMAITLYHIYKLLHSHGVRPALEMLQTKMQEGTLRLLARNSRLQEIKNLMQESVGHGAPSPKLVKLEAIILQHFRDHDPLTTRVIIFTNFRESVKDILEALLKVGHIVKAMEFIGQSSGKASKGQTQKMQQAVLQKFRSGGFNTIVATSIAEEGLDIMEVDLVICFDANISPLRMIQRMGRTGRKRDGRVVVLASEGAEVQGYLKKQAKNKALGKHMQHGGVNSFSFHPSPRMVPHMVKPQVEMTEMKIEQYVPRGKNKSVEGVAVPDSEGDELTEEEQALLRKYALPPGAEPWRPSLIAFPKYQLLPTPVHAVKHSTRTVSMFIDVLRSLQEPGFLGSAKDSLPSQLGFASLSIAQQNLDTGAAIPTGSAVVNSPVKTFEDNLDEDEPVDQEMPFNEAIYIEDPNLRGPQAFPNELKSSQHENVICNDILNATGRVTFLEENTPRNDSSPIKDTMRKCSTVLPVTIHSHQFLFNTSIVYKNSAGELEIASPPEWRPREVTNVPDDQLTTLGSSPQREAPQDDDEFFIAGTPEDKLPRAATLMAGSYSVAVKEVTAADSFISPAPVPSLAHVSTLSPILETPDLKKHETTPPYRSRLRPPLPPSLRREIASTSKRICETSGDLPRMLESVSRAVITNSDVVEVENKAHLSLDTYVASQSPAKPKALNFDDIAVGHNGMPELDKINAFHSREKVQTQLPQYLQKSPTVQFQSLQKSLPIQHQAQQRSPPVQPQSQQKLSPVQSLMQPQSQQKSPPIQSLIQPQTRDQKTPQTPPILLHETSPRNPQTARDVHILSLSKGTPSTGQNRSRKFKRLKKARDLVRTTQLDQMNKKMRGSSKQVEHKQVATKKHTRLGGKVQRRFAVHPFIDEEAEESSDEAVSTDDSDTESGEEESQDSFIDTSNSQHLHSGSIDMMAVYRRSLLTQSPVGGGYLEVTTPTANTSITLVSSDTGETLSRRSNEPPSVSRISYSAPIPLGCSKRNGNSVPSRPFKCPADGKENVPPNSVDATPVTCAILDGEDADDGRKSSESRKRKLSFHLQEEDDVFAGLDLDALEEEATCQARLRSTQGVCSSAVMPSFDLGFED
ncbi:DEAD-box ATP-dependent RNA helicase FANCM isoform X3 [Physcomitrium patens]|nr:DEAD-box ATP-dependent RNA helicase FANCM-like isoform X3 [Physcomitrium patens]|eukprot:XP_024357672.1 DEAD-box ATP-dependent RNA helicase FANCM-like isoform X3 [Physcomitrella patens]